MAAAGGTAELIRGSNKSDGDDPTQGVRCRGMTAGRASGRPGRHCCQAATGRGRAPEELLAAHADIIHATRGGRRRHDPSLATARRVVVKISNALVVWTSTAAAPGPSARGHLRRHRRDAGRTALTWSWFLPAL